MSTVLSFSSAQSLDDVEPNVVARIITFCKRRIVCFQLSKAWSRHLSTHYPVRMKKGRKDVLAHLWKSQRVEMHSITDFRLLSYLPLRHLVLYECSIDAINGANRFKLPNLENLELHNCRVHRITLTGIQRLSLIKSSVGYLEGNASSLRTLDLRGYHSHHSEIPNNRDFPGLKRLILNFHAPNFSELIRFLDRFYKTIEHLTMKLPSLNHSIFGSQILPKLKRLDLSFKPREVRVKIAEWNLIMVSLNRLTRLEVDNLKVISCSGKGLKWPPKLSQLFLSNFEVEGNKVIALPNGLVDISLLNTRELIASIEDVSRLRTVIISNFPIDKDSITALILATKEGRLKLLAYKHLKGKCLRSLKNSNTTTSITNRVYYPYQF